MIVLNQKLQLAFKTASNDIRAIKIPHIRDDLDNETVVNAMNRIIESEALTLGGSRPIGNYRARKIITSETAFVITN